MHQIQLVVWPVQRLRHYSTVSDHANGILDLCKVAAGDDDRPLVVDADLEPACPVNSFGLA
jgi:hypothetical protein